MARLILLVLVLAFAVAVPFAIWGGDVEARLSVDTLVARLAESPWGAVIGIGLILSDIALPVPSTAVMAALGIVYGPLRGGLIAAAGSFLAGSAGYWLCRLIGPETATRLAGPEGLVRARAMLDRWGLGIVALSRWLPVLPETVAFVAGLVRMPYPRFAAGLVLGALPHGLLFAAAGHLGRETPLVIIAATALLPLALAALIHRFRKTGAAE